MISGTANWRSRPRVARIAAALALVLGLTLVAPVPPAGAAIDTYTWNGCKITIDVHEHWGRPRIVVDENYGCARIRAKHVYDNNGTNVHLGVWTTATSTSLTDSGDQCKGRGYGDTNTSGSYGTSPWVIHDSRNC